MKKIKWKIILISLLMLPMMLLPGASCKDDGDGIMHTVSFYSGTTETLYDELQVEDGKKITLPQEPTKSGYIFVGWYKDITCEHSWDFSKDTVTQDIIIYAKWEKAENIDGENPVE